MTSWTTPRDWADGELAASDLNTDVRDNMKNVDERLDLHGLTSESTVGALRSAGYGVRVTNSAGVNVPHATDKTFHFDAESWDDANFWAASPSPTQVTIPSTGRYEVSASCQVEANGTGWRQLTLEVDGSPNDPIQQDRRSGFAQEAWLHIHDELSLTAGQVLTLTGYQNSQSTLVFFDIVMVVRRTAVS